MADEQSTRDRVRALVRDVLANALPADEPQHSASLNNSPPPAPPSPTDAAKVRG